jgi:site-specific recombinase XerD
MNRSTSIGRSTRRRVLSNEMHDLRHAHATLMLRAGMQLKVASQRLGHGSLGITAELYRHVVADLDTGRFGADSQGIAK